ncbi:MAG: TRZ/ATZ family hydrolase [Nevskia sp.]|uniref:TRZ/ATZ family hydrolase n=1 Tax=Nevskia sp. TaxID=1929292 RepID=UPI00403506C4
MQTIDLLVFPKWLVPIEPEGVALVEHALAIRDGRIVDILPAAFARQTYQPADTLELPEHALMPGLINGHTHSAMALMRGLADDLPLMDWLNNHIWPAEAAVVSRAFCVDGVRLACAEMIRGGTTCFNDMYFFPDATAEVAAAVGLRATIGLLLIDFPTAWATDADDYIRKGLDVYEHQIRRQPLLRAAFAPHAPYTVSDAPLLKIRALATEMGLPIHMHVHETADEVNQALAGPDGRRPLARLKALDLLGPDFIAVHMTQLSDEEIADCGRLGLSIAHCPESNLKLASGIAPIARLIAAGANVMVGTDGAASNNDLDLLAETRTAALLAKGASGDPRAVPAATALKLATLNGARALGIDNETGSLAVGKSADFIAIDLSPASTTPVYDVISTLAYAVGRDQVTDVYVAGRALMRNRQLLTLDEPAVLAKAADWRAKIAAATRST